MRTGTSAERTIQKFVASLKLDCIWLARSDTQSTDCNHMLILVWVNLMASLALLPNHYLCVPYAFISIYMVYGTISVLGLPPPMYFLSKEKRFLTSFNEFR